MPAGDFKRRAAIVFQWHVLPLLARVIGEPVSFSRRRTSRVDLRRARQILVVRLDAIGDVVLTGPFLRELRRNCPNARITLVVNPAAADIVELCPYVDEVLVFDPLGRGLVRRATRHLRTLAFAWRRLLPRHFDLCLLPRWDLDLYNSSLLAFASGAARRVAHSVRPAGPPYAGSPNLDLLVTDPIDDATPRHEVQRSLDILRYLGGTVAHEHLELWLGPSDRAVADTLLGAAGVEPGDRIVAFGVGAGEPQKVWPIDRFVEVGRSVLSEPHRRILVIGGREDRPAGERLRRELGDRVIDLTGRATLRATGAALARCSLCLTNDTGPMHLAAAAGTPVVEIAWQAAGGSPSHRASPARFGPWGVPCQILRPPRPVPPCVDGCGSREKPHCILEVAVAEAVAAISRLLTP